MMRKFLVQVMGVLLAAGMTAGNYATAMAAETETEKTAAEKADDSTAEDGEEEEYEPQLVSVSGWNITVEDVMESASLENVSDELGYTGVEKSDYQKEAEDGKTFCLVKLIFEKDGSKESIQWDKLKLADSEGNEYTRMEDEFLTDLGMLRMPGTTLNFGSNEGWIVFEINEDAEELVLSYPFDTEKYSCTL